MNADDVLFVYDHLVRAHVGVWIDGGWCVDALIGEVTRYHPDLDLAVDHKDEEKLRQVLDKLGMYKSPTDDETAWNYVMKRADRQVDIHIFEYDNNHDNVYGIKYPYGSLTGTGIIKGQKVNCISPEWMFKFKTAYEPKEKDIADVQALSEHFGFHLPTKYVT